MKKNIIKNIIPFIMATFTYSVFCNNNILKSFDISSWLIYGMAILLFYKTDIIGKNNRKESIVFSCVLSSIIVYGGLLFKNIHSSDISVINETLKFKSLLSFVSYFNILFILFKNLFPKLYDAKLVDSREKKLSNIKVFFICLILILLAWLPYFLSFYPGTLTVDSISEFKSIHNGIHIVSDHHPVIHALFVGLFYNLGMFIFKNTNAAIALTTVMQMLILSSIFAYTIIFLRKRNVKKSILLITLICYCLLPMNGYYSITMWKDVIFAGCFLLLITELIKLIEKNSNQKLLKKDMISFVLVSLLCIFFRNNAFYMYLLLFFVITLFIGSLNRKIVVLSFIIVFGCYFTIKGPIFSMCHIKNSESSEYIGIPLQQIGRMAYKDVVFTNKELKSINKLIPIDVMKNSYNPYVVDSIKFNPSYNEDVFNNNKKEYLKLYLSLLFKHPAIAVESYSISTLGFWYPGVVFWSVANWIEPNEYGIKMNSIIKNDSNSLIRKIENRDFPVLSIEWSIGLYFWMLFLAFYISIRKKGINALIVFAPCIGIWLTLMVATPVFAEFRYIYCVIVSIPVMLLYPYIGNKRNLT